MSIQPSPHLRGLIHVHKHADNGFTPEDGFYSRITGTIAHLVAFRRKVLYQRDVALGTSGGTSGTAWRWHCKTGAGCARIVVMAILGIDDRNTASDPYIEVDITRESTATTTTLEFHGGESTATATDAPEEHMVFADVMTAYPQEVYTGAVDFLNDVRVISLIVELVRRGGTFA